jgi:hypothetical protein
MADTDRECTVCEEVVLESELMFKVSITDMEGTVFEYETVCESCKEEVKKAIGYGPL